MKTEVLVFSYANNLSDIDRGVAIQTQLDALSTIANPQSITYFERKDGMKVRVTITYFKSN
jgi:hypothetical protein